jgi:hypothetical protein
VFVVLPVVLGVEAGVMSPTRSSTIGVDELVAERRRGNRID